MTFKKAIFLFLALLFPVAIFIFLKMFGRNEFQVPVRHAHGPLEVSANCPFEYQTPYRVPDSLFTSLNLERVDSLYVFYFDPSLSTAMNRIEVEFNDAPVRLVSPAVLGGAEDVRFVRECILLTQGDTTSALVDHRNRIRGYYDGHDRDEIDRLMVEIKIILKQY